MQKCRALFLPHKGEEAQKDIRHKKQSSMVHQIERSIDKNLQGHLYFCMENSQNNGNDDILAGYRNNVQPYYLL